MKDLLARLIDEKAALAIAEHLNAQTLYQNPRTGTVQGLDLWRSEQDRETPRPSRKANWSE